MDNIKQATMGNDSKMYLGLEEIEPETEAPPAVNWVEIEVTGVDWDNAPQWWRIVGDWWQDE